MVWLNHQYLASKGDPGLGVLTAWPGAQGLTPLGITWAKDLGDSETAGGEGGTSQQPARVRIPTGSVLWKVHEGGDNGPGGLLTKLH